MGLTPVYVLVGNESYQGSLERPSRHDPLLDIEKGDIIWSNGDSYFDPDPDVSRLSISEAMAGGSTGLGAFKVIQFIHITHSLSFLDPTTNLN